MSNNTDLMIDLETLDVRPTATVLTIGAVKFDPFSLETEKPTADRLYIKVDIDSCHALGCTVCDATIEWWSRQSEQAQQEAFDPAGRVDVRNAIDQLYRFAWGCHRVWSHGAGFDVVICEHLYKQVGRAAPWQYWQVRDTRTMFDLGIDPARPPVLKHHALEDAWNQAVGVQNVVRTLAKLGIDPFRKL